MNYPTQPGYPQQQAQGYPQQTPQPQPQAFVPTGAAAAVQQQASQNVWTEVCNQPKRTPVNRQRIDDGTHHVQLKECLLKPSNKDGRLMLLFQFTVIASTVPQCVGQEFGFPQFMSNKMQLQDLSDIAKDIWGEDTVSEWARQGVQFADVAAYIGQYVTNKYCVLTARRSNRQGESYDTAFINHTFRNFVDNPQALPQLPVPCAPQMQPQAPAMPMPPQPQSQPQAPAMPMPPQPQSQPQAPAMPMPPQPQGQPQAPAMPMPPQPQGQPQAPAMPMPPQPQGQPQAPAMPMPPQPQGQPTWNGPGFNPNEPPF